MNVVFRTDASLFAGSGHMMRCLSLAHALRSSGAQCHFISRTHEGHLNDLVRERGFEVFDLPANELAVGTDSSGGSAYAGWLGCSMERDAQQTAAYLERLRPDWLVVDHYAIGASWEADIRPYAGKLMVIDDLADRAHVCDLLLDQNLGRASEHYEGLVPGGCTLLMGPRFALLRDEFALARGRSLRRRQAPMLKRLLIAMGGVDQPDATSTVLDALRHSRLPDDCAISVIMGSQAMWLARVREQAQAMPWRTEVLVNIADMAARMSESDLAIGAAGMTSWERCSLGLPALIVVLAPNQLPGAKALSETGAALLLGEVDDVPVRLPAALSSLVEGGELSQMTSAAAAVTDGLGMKRVVDAMEQQI
jgi:UDP-2,4-diacetamido-2,4,6-trideoxy-beta-L-altropyranose hydrolase